MSMPAETAAPEHPRFAEIRSAVETFLRQDARTRSPARLLAILTKEVEWEVLQGCEAVVSHAWGRKILGVKEVTCDPSALEANGIAVWAHGTLVVAYSPRFQGDADADMLFDFQAELTPGDVTVLITEPDDPDDDIA